MAVGDYTFDNITYTKYGGYADIDFVGNGGVYKTGTAGTWGMGKIGNRWVIVDPSGKVVLLRGQTGVKYDVTHQQGVFPINQVYTQFINPPGNLTTKTPTNTANWTWKNNIDRKYGSATAWRAVVPTRMRTFHYNWAAYASENFTSANMPQIYEWPFASLYANHEPFHPLGVGNACHDVHGPLMLKGAYPTSGLYPSIPDSFYRHVLDYFDPNWAAFCAVAPFAPGQNPNTLWSTTDDGDFISQIFSSGTFTETGFQPNQAAVAIPHHGLMALCVRPTLTSQPSAYIPPPNSYTNTWTTGTIYTKKALIDRLKVKYNNSITDLNTAWGTGGHYTSFDLVDGWGLGTRRGLMDEDGIIGRTWFGLNATTTPSDHIHVSGMNDFYDSTTWGLGGSGSVVDRYGDTVKHLKADFDEHLYQAGLAFAVPERNRINAIWPNATWGGPTGGFGGVAPRKPMIKIFQDYFDVLQGAQPTDLVVNAWLAGQDKPVSSFIYADATSSDSDLWWVGEVARLGQANTLTQAQRGANVANFVNALMTKQVAGVYPFIGYWMWNIHSQVGEAKGWGVSSYQDNPFDGNDYREYNAVTRPNALGGKANADLYTPGIAPLIEDANHGPYGNTITPIKNAHIAMKATLLSQITPAVPAGRFEWDQPVGTQSIAFTDTPSGNPPANLWTWNFGDGTTLSGSNPAIHQNPTHAYATIGLKTVTHTAANALGTSPVVSKQVSVTVPQTGFELRQAVEATSGPAADVVVSAANITVGDLVVVMVDCDQPPSGTFAVADNLGNAYTGIGSIVSWGPARMRAWYTVATVGGNNPSVFVAMVGNVLPVSYCWVGVYITRVVGVPPNIALTNSPPVVVGSNVASPLTSGTINTPGQGLVLGWAAKSVAAATMQSPFVAVPGISRLVGHLPLASAGTYTFRATYTGLSSWGAQILSFRPTTGGPSPTNIPTDPASLAWTGKDLSLPGIIALASAALTWTGKDLDVQNVVTTTVVTTDPATLTWTGSTLVTPNLRVRATLTLDFFNRPDGPLT